MHTVPILILSGFLGSGKTTFLTRTLKECVRRGIKPAIIMNEVGEINLDGQLVDESVPMREMLSGCICCTIRGDLSIELTNLIDSEKPELIIIEATGVANPIEILDTITETAMIAPIEIRANTTVIDAGDFLRRSEEAKGKTYRLMKDQIRCASVLIVNKTDLVSAEELKELKKMLYSINSVAPMIETVECNLDQDDWGLFLEKGGFNEGTSQLLKLTEFESVQTKHEHACEHKHEHEHNHEHCHNHHTEAHPHSYDHLVVHTHYFTNSLNPTKFEQLFTLIPDSVYRAKGIFTDANSGQKVLFQYAFRQLELTPIQPQGEVQDVAVIIGEHFPKEVVVSILGEVESHI